VRREAEQNLWDHDGKRLRWEGERQKAAFLKTSGGNGDIVLYWLPWDMTEAQKATVAEQIKAAEASIVSEGGEVASIATADGQDFVINDDGQSLKPQSNDNQSASELKDISNAELMTIETADNEEVESNRATVQPSTISNGTNKFENAAADLSNPAVNKELLEDPEGEEADVVVEAGEDAVIY